MSAVPAPAVPEIRQTAPRLAIADRPAGDLFAPGRLRALGVKSAWSLVDQGLTALTGFCVTFLLARWLAPEIYGAYAIAFAGYLFVGGLHNVMVLEPMSVIGPSRHAARLQEYFRAQLVVHGVLVGMCSGVAACIAVLVWLLAPESALAGAIAGSALALPFLLSLFLARRMCYVRQRPFTATLGSGCCLVLALVGLYMLRHFEWVSPCSVFLLVGVASFVGSCLVFRQVGVGTFRAKWGFRRADGVGFGVERELGVRAVVGRQHDFVFGVGASADVFGSSVSGIGSGRNIASDDVTGVGDDAGRHGCEPAGAAGIFLRLWARAGRSYTAESDNCERRVVRSGDLFFGDVVDGCGAGGTYFVRGEVRGVRVAHAHTFAGSRGQWLDDGFLDSFAGVAETSLGFAGERDCCADRGCFGGEFYSLVGACGRGREYGDWLCRVYGRELLGVLCGARVGNQA